MRQPTTVIFGFIFNMTEPAIEVSIEGDELISDQWTCGQCNLDGR